MRHADEHRLDIALLGPPSVEADGEPIAVDTRKAIAVLAHVAVTGTPQSRDTLAALLWPEHPQDRARAALRRTLSSLRRALDGRWLRTSRDVVTLDPAGVLLDVEGFRRGIRGCEPHAGRPEPTCADCVSRLARAVDLYRGDFMAGFSLRGSNDFEGWQLAEADRLRSELAGALDTLSAAHAAGGDLGKGVAQAQRWLDLDPLNEAAHRRLMLLHAWGGDRGAALRQYRACVAALEEELGVPPLEETAELYHAIREGEIPAAPEPSVPRQPPTREPSVGPPRVPMVGRDPERRLLLDAYAATGPDGRLIVVEGEAGVGKTRLVEHVLEELAAVSGARVVAVRCYEDEATVALGPVAEALREALDRAPEVWLEGVPAHRLAEATRLLPELAGRRQDLPTPPPLDHPGARRRFFDAITNVLQGATFGPPPGVLFVDDLHWADASSLDLLAYLARRLSGRPLLVVMTWRTELVGRGARPRRILDDARGSGLASSIELGRLTLQDVEELVRAAAPPGRDPEELRDLLYTETEGLPFFCAEYLTAIAQGAGTDLPTGARSLLASRVQGVSGRAGQVLATAAVIGRSFDLATVRDASGRSEDETVAALEELLRLGLIIETDPDPDAGGASYVFSHHKIRAFVYEQTSLARRRLLHRRVAEALARSPQSAGALAGLVALHLREAGLDEDAAEHHRVAGHHARSLWANTEALDHFRSALALGHTDASGLHEAIGDLETLEGNYQAALASYEAATALSRGPRALCRLEHKLARVHMRQGDWAAADSHLEAARASLTGEALGDRARILADRSLTMLNLGRPEDAARAADEALSYAEEAGDDEALAQAHNILGILARRRGDPDAATAHLEPSLDIADGLADPSAAIAALNNLALVRGDTGDHEGGLDLIRRALRLCIDQGDRHRQAALHNNTADLLRAAGRDEEALDHLKQAAAIFSEIGEPDRLQPEIWKLVDW